MQDNIQGAISKAEFKIKNGRLKIKKVKLKSDVSDNIDKLTAKVMNDTVPVEVRKKINKEVRKDINPAKGAHNIVADTKAEISKEVGRDMGMEMS
jgi:tetrahydromethanopterin S-methyltransferase subunit G